MGHANGEGGLTLHIREDGTFSGAVVANSSSVHRVAGSFQPDGSIHLNISYSLGTVWQGTARSQGHNKYVGTFVVSFADITLRTGIWALVPVLNPQNVVAVDLSAFITAGPDQKTPFGGVMILDHEGLYGTLRLQDGRVLPVYALILQNKIAFTFVLNKHQFVFAIGTPATLGK